MSTLEHLFMQTFERREWIEGQLRQQAESYSQTMAYNLVADGVPLPPWFWPSGSGDVSTHPDLKELNREQLISEILFPLPPSTSSLSNCNTIFTLPVLRGDHVNKYFYAKQRDIAVTSICQNSSQKNSDMMVEPEAVEACGDSDPFTRVQRSRSRQKDLEIRLAKKLKATNQLGEESEERVASANANFFKQAADSFFIHNEDGPRVIQSRFRANEVDCEKFVKPARLFDLVDDAACKPTEGQRDCTAELPLDVDIHDLNDMVEIAPCRCSTGSIGKGWVSCETHPVHSRLEVCLGQESTMDVNSCRIHSPKFASEKADCEEKAFNGDRISGSRPIPSIEVDNRVLNSIDAVTPQSCATETLGKELISDAAYRSQPGFELMHGTISVHSKTLSLGEQMSPHFECIEECHLDVNSAVPFRKESLDSFSEVGFTDLEAKESVKEDSCGDPKKATGSIRSRQVHEENSMCTAEGFCRTEEDDIISSRDPYEENFEPHSQPAVSNRPFLIPSSPIEATCSISENASMHSSSMRDGELNLISNAKHDSGKLVKQSSNAMECGPAETNHLVEAKHVLSHSANLETVHIFKQLPCIDSSAAYVSLENGQLQVEDAFPTPEHMRERVEEVTVVGEKEDDTNRLLEAEEADAALMEVEKRSASRPTTTPDATVSRDSASGSWQLFRNSDIRCMTPDSFKANDSILPSNRSVGCLSTQGTRVDVVEKSIFGKTPNTDENFNDLPKSNYFLRTSRSHECIAEKTSTKPALKCNSLETLSVSEKAPYFLRSLASQEKNVISKPIVDKEASDPTKSMKAISWPKRKKMEGRSNNIFATSHRLRLKSLDIHGGNCRCKITSENSDCRCRKILENASEVVIEHQPFHVLSFEEAGISNTASRSPIELLNQSDKCRMEGCSYMEGEDQAVVAQSPINLTQEVPFTDLADVSSRVCLKDKLETTISEDGEDYTSVEHVLEHGKPEYFCGEEEFTETEMCDRDQTTGGPSHFDDALVDYDETMPEYEGFSIGVPSITEGENFFNDPVFRRLTEERASMLEELCRSRSLLTPGSLTSSKNRIYEVPDVYQSLPSGLLEHMNFTDSCKYSNVSMKQLRASEDGRITGVCCNLGSDFDGSLAARSSLHKMPSRKPPLTPPVEKFSQRMMPSRGRSSSEKVGSNPELTCFRIDENSITTDENRFLDELNSSGEMIGSIGIKDSVVRAALVDVSRAYQNSPNLISVSKKFLDRDSLESVRTESFCGTQVSDNSSLGKGRTSKSRSKLHNKENHVLSISGKRVHKSLRSRSSKPEISGNTSQRNRSRVDTVKGCRPNNIVSNVSSFIPLVRQKQEAAAPVKGKKDIKVKALEVAEAAKRLEEKKQHERDQRKAAAKLERERLEQENARRLELEQKKKKEERRKKEVDTAARKRQREEGKKDQERKRRCTGTTRKHQREQDERVRLEKEEKELRFKAADEKERSKNELEEVAKQQLKSEKGVAGSKIATEAESTTKAVEEDTRRGCDSVEAHGAYVISNVYEKVVRNSNTSQETIRVSDLQSYDMSPYIDSDNEDGEEESRRRRKFVPLWARRESLDQTILSKKDLDPSAIFLSKRSFDLTEVLLPRRKRPI